MVWRGNGSCTELQLEFVLFAVHIVVIIIIIIVVAITIIIIIIIVNESTGT